MSHRSNVVVVGFVLVALGGPQAHAGGDTPRSSSLVIRAGQVVMRLLGRSRPASPVALKAPAPSLAAAAPSAAPAPRPELRATLPAPRPALPAALSAARHRPDVATMVTQAKRLEPPFAPLGYDDSYAGGEGPVTILRTGRGPHPTRYIWFHGAGQATHNELINRMAAAYHESGLNLEIYSVPYEGSLGIEVAKEIARTSPDKVIVGGHSAGGFGVERMLREVPDKIAAVATINAGTPRAAGIPALHFQGENDGGGFALKRMNVGGTAFRWGDRQVVLLGDGLHREAVLRIGDHSARAREAGDPDKARASTSEATRLMNLELARTLKQFLELLAVHR